MTANNNHINYLEFKSSDLLRTKEFYSTVFEWEFVDYGPKYSSFTAASSGVDGGFELSDEPINNGALVVLYNDDLEGVITKVKKAGGSITIDIFEFPGGKRFHFADPDGNELAVWSE